MAFLKDQLAAVEKSINIQLEEFGSDAIQTHITLQQQVKHLQAKLAELEQRRDQLTKENEKLKAEIQVQKPIMDEWVKEALVLEAQCREYEETRNTIQQASVNRVRQSLPKFFLSFFYQHTTRAFELCTNPLYVNMCRRML